MRITTLLILALTFIAKISVGFDCQTSLSSPPIFIGPANVWYVDGRPCMMLGALPNGYIKVLENLHFVELPANFYGAQAPICENRAGIKIDEQAKKSTLAEPINETVKLKDPAKIEPATASKPLSYLAALKYVPKKEQPYLKSFNRNKFEIIKSNKALECSKAVFHLSKKESEIKKDPRFINLFAEQLDDPEAHKYMFSFLFNQKQELLDVMGFMPKQSLKKLFLHGEWIDDDILSAVGKHFKSSMVSYLDLSYCPNITDEGLKDLVKQFNGISYLNLNFCQKIRGNYLSELDPEPIRYLELAECNITDESLLSFSNIARNLRTINLNGCKNITGKAFAGFAAKFQSIRNIHLKGCFLISPQELERVINSIKKHLFIFDAPR